MALSEFLNNLFATWTGVVQAGAALAAIVLIVVVAIASRLAWGKILVTTMVAALVIWAVTLNGLGFFSDTIDQETANTGSSSSHQQVTSYDLAA